MFKHKIALGICLILLIGTLVPFTSVAQTGNSVLTEEYDSQLARDWVLTVYELVRDYKVNPPSAARIYAYTGVALYEGVVNGMPLNFSIGGQLQGLALLPYPEESLTYDFPAIANATVSTVLTGLFQERNADDEAFERIDAMRETQTALRLEEIDEEIVDRSLALGDEIGGALLDWIANDNYGPTRKMTYDTPVDDPSYWVETTEGAAAMEPFWGLIRPFGLSYPEQCNEPIRLEFSSEPDSTFYAQAKEVLDASDNLTDEQRDIARFWVDTPGITGAPAGHWMLIATQFAESSDMSLARASEMYILLGAALGDAFISAWDQKYKVNLVRPVTYINRYQRRNWAPYIETPPFPEYPSGHSVGSGAAAEVLTIMFGQQAFTDRTPIINGHEELQRSFTSFEQAASEAAISRMYGGIHYRAAIELGLRQGRCVGQAVLNNVRLRSIPQGEGLQP